MYSASASVSPSLRHDELFVAAARLVDLREMQAIGQQVVGDVGRGRQIVDLGESLLQRRESRGAHAQCASWLREAGTGSSPSLRSNVRERSLPVLTHNSYSRSRSRSEC